jgi:hypothetical protein
MHPDEAIWLPDDGTPTTHVLAGFCLLMVVQERENDSPPDHYSHEAEDLQLTRWANDYLVANQPLTAAGCAILRGLAAEAELSEPEFTGLMNLAEDEFGILDIWIVSLNGPISPAKPKPE